ncbi:hypothetical protein ACFO5X_19630 [Seohaeicola nanhaiensis]|uniref:Cobalt transporter n=1 Tax=Seohaeicola nanhaiensis TaxID=1387282 RepID=A0ABV9KMF0_9RHOB
MAFILWSIVLSGVVHAHVEGAEPRGHSSVFLDHPNPSVGTAEGKIHAATGHCSGAATCHAMFLPPMTNDAFAPETEDAPSVELTQVAALTPVYGLFRPPRRG